MFEMWAIPTSVTLQYPVRLSDVSGKPTCTCTSKRKRNTRGQGTSYTYMHIHRYSELLLNSLANNIAVQIYLSTKYLHHSTSHTTIFVFKLPTKHNYFTMNKMIHVYCLVGFFYVAKFSCFREKSNLVHLFSFWSLRRKTMPTLLLRLHVFNFCFSSLENEKKQSLARSTKQTRYTIMYSTKCHTHYLECGKVSEKN